MKKNSGIAPFLLLLNDAISLRNIRIRRKWVHAHLTIDLSKIPALVGWKNTFDPTFRCSSDSGTFQIEVRKPIDEDWKLEDWPEESRKVIREKLNILLVQREEERISRKTF